MKRLHAAQALIILLALVAIPAAVEAQQAPQQGAVASPPPAIEDTITAAETDAPVRRLVKFNEVEGKAGSIRVGFGLLFDYARFDQDETSKEQFPDLDNQWKYRDGRVLLSGRFGFERPITWSAGIMYDGANKEWVMRQTGIMVAVPEIWGHVFVGRTKEGFSLNKVMIGYGGWTHERAPINDATVPILADGVKWLGYAPKARILWNLGVYGDALSEGQGFSSYSNQISGRLAWVPILSADGGTLLHIGVAERFGKVKDGQLRLKARPGAWAAPFFIDTAQFPADSTRLTGTEIYYRPGSLTFGSEYFFQRVDSPETGNPFFHGGEVVATWLITGEVRTYNTKGGYLNQISPKKPVFSGGPGAWEIVAHFSRADLDSKSISGGTYWRFTPMVNWYLSDNFRLEGIYGYGSLDRFGGVGKTHFLQFRIQTQL